MDALKGLVDTELAEELKKAQDELDAAVKLETESKAAAEAANQAAAEANKKAAEAQAAADEAAANAAMNEQEKASMEAEAKRAADEAAAANTRAAEADQAAADAAARKTAAETALEKAKADAREAIEKIEAAEAAAALASAKYDALIAAQAKYDELSEKATDRQAQTLTVILHDIKDSIEASEEIAQVEQILTVGLEELEAVLEETPVDPEQPFVDVTEGAYYYDAMLWAVDNGITTGTSATTFEPGTACTRGQVVTFLWRAAGEPAPTTTETAFTDIEEGAYYYEAVLWAVENGITAGTSETTFSPNETCTRGQVVTFLWRAAEEPKAADAEHSFTDVSEGAFYYDAMLWAVENGITAGTTATTFAPSESCTRGQVVTFLFRAQ